MKAFLSHSSVDKPYVEIVAKRLGRRRVLYDEWDFQSGEQFMSAIRAALARSGAFVLFASRHSLQSLWVKFEISEAEELLRTEVLKSSLVIIIDSETTPPDLPRWMQRSLVSSVPSPNAAARIIEHRLNEMRGITANALFIGREDLLAELSQALISSADRVPPHILLLGGLPGIGRRTFLQHALPNILSVNVGPTFHLRTTDGLDALHVALLEELGALDTRKQLSSAIEQFQASNADEQIHILAEMLASCAVGNIAPVIVDEGSLLESGGAYTEEALSLLKALHKYTDRTFSIVHTKRPTISPAELEEFGAIYNRVPPLALGAVSLLLTQSFRRTGIEATSAQIAELAPYLDGYPPAVNLSVAVAKQYGLPNLLADKSGLVDYKIQTFASILEKLSIDKNQWTILRVLGVESSLPLDAIAVMAGTAEDRCAQSLRRLIDLNLVLPDDNNFTIAPPIKAAVYSLAGRITESDYTRLAAHLKKSYWDDSERLPSLDVVTATIHAVMRSQSPDLSHFKGIVIPSVVYRAAKEFYDQGGVDAWERARTLTAELLRMDRNHRQGLTLMFKAQVRLKEWDGAAKTLDTVRSKKWPEQHYLNGFVLWKKRQFASAITAFRQALASGQEAMEIYHGLAICLLRMDKLREAERVVQDALRSRRPNRLLVDLAAQLAISTGNYSDAKEYIDQLRRMKADADYHHRLATLLNRQNKPYDALKHAELAMDGPRRRFEVEATYVDTLIEVEDFSRADGVLTELDKRGIFGRENKEVRVGLRCKLYLRQGKWREAEQAWLSLDEKGSPVHVALRKETIEQKIADLKISPGARAAARDELTKLGESPHVGQVPAIAADDDLEATDGL